MINDVLCFLGLSPGGFDPEFTDCTPWGSVKASDGTFTCGSCASRDARHVEGADAQCWR